MLPPKNVSKPQSIQLATELHQKLSDTLDDNVEVILFGLQTWGDAAEESDVDILVLLSNLEKSTLNSVLDISQEVGFETEKDISVILATHDQIKSFSTPLFFLAVQREDILM